MFTQTRTIEWGDCDAAGIVFYPNYFSWMDAAFHAFTQSLGFDQRSLAREGYLGTPLVDARCRFVSPARYYDTLSVRVAPTKIGRTSLGMGYGFYADARLVAEGAEVRAFVAETSEGLAPKAAPERVRAALTKALVPPG